MQGDLFGYPEPLPELSQWYTPHWLCRRIVTEWVPRKACVLEPACGPGNFIDELLRAGHDPALITAIDIDPRNVAQVEERFEGKVAAMCANFLELELAPSFDIVLGNFPFEKNEHLAFTVKALSLAPRVAAVYPATFESTQGRDRELWRTRGVVRRRAFLPERVEYGGASNGTFESIVLNIGRRMQTRRAGEVREVSEETWLRDDQAQLEHFAEVP